MLHRVGLRALVAYALLLALLRLSGKRLVSECTPADLMMSLFLGDMIDDYLWADVPPMQFFVAATTVVLTHLLVTFGRGVWPRFERLVEGAPIVAMRGGRPALEQLRGERISRFDLAAALRSCGLTRHRWSEVRAAYIENDGSTSSLPWPNDEPARRSDAPRAARLRAREARRDSSAGQGPIPPVAG
ncbi:MAG: YetF domain-containing protein [Gemmatimonadaceae bacterium]